MPNTICPGGGASVWVRLKEIAPGGNMGWASVNPCRKGIPLVRLKCPKCGRRMMSKVEIYHDGDYAIHTIPPHKIKHWWKKNKKRKTNR